MINILNLYALWFKKKFYQISTSNYVIIFLKQCIDCLVLFNNNLINLI